MLEKAVIHWLKEGPSWLLFALETQLNGKQLGVSTAVDDAQLQPMIKRLKDNNSGIPALVSGELSYTSTGNAFWDLFFLSDIGLRIDDIHIEDEVNSLLSQQNFDGTFVFQNGTKSSYYCIPAIVLSSLAKMGYSNHPKILKFIEKVFETQRVDGGWHCAASRDKGKRLQDSASCPMDNLNILMLLGQYEQYRVDARLNGAIDLLLVHWKRKIEPWRPYGFGIGSDFLKLKYPAVKYGILRVLDVLSLYPYAVKSSEFKEMFAFVMNKSIDGRFFAESVSRSYSDFDFGQTKQPSRWITYLIYRIQKRVSVGDIQTQFK
jgi:hypothetical protein